jgi:large subunit ribosomal protein L18
MLEKQEKRLRRHRRIRAKIKGTAKIPRLCVFKSGKYIYAQLIDDGKNIIMASATDKGLKKSHSVKEEKDRTGKKLLAFEVGKIIGKKALENKIEKVVFDRGGYKYHGRIKGLAEGAREAGLKF